MLGRRHRAFPLEAARDLLGVIRVLYASGTVERRLLTKAGRLLREAIELALRYPTVDCVGHRAAWKKGEDAVALLGAAMDAIVQLETVVEAGTSRVTGERRMVVLRAQRKAER